MIPVVAPLHAGHWLWDGLFAAPVLVLAAALGWRSLRRRLRGEGPPEDLDDPAEDRTHPSPTEATRAR